MRRTSLFVRFLCYLTLLARLGFPAAAAIGAEPPEHTHSKHVIVISIDGMMPAAYLHPAQYNLKIPNLQRLMAEGSYAAGVEGVFPSVTYPSHATLVTGVLPAVHGIYANEVLNAANLKEKKFFWEAKAFRARTLWDAAREAGLKTAAVGWPATIGAAIDYHIPEIWDPKNEDTGKDFRYGVPHATPGLVAAIEREFGRSTSKPLDEARTDAAVYILRNYRPHLLLLHIYDLDTAQHYFGPMSPQALEKLELADKQIGRLIEAAREAGILPESAVVVVSDHGFLPIQRDINLGRLLIEKGLVRRTKDGKITHWTAVPVVTGGSCYLFLHQPAHEKEVKKLYDALEPYVRRGAIAAVFSAAATKDLTGVEGAMMLEAGAGHRFKEGWSRPTVLEASERRGSHGYLPFRPGMEASFIAVGPGIRAGVRLPQIRMTSIAPTLAALLGVSLPQADAESILSALFP